MKSRDGTMDYVNRFYISSLLHIAFYSGFYQIYLQSLGLSKAQIGLLIGLSLILVALLEVPTGVVADKVSKKASVLISKALTIPNVLVLYLAHSFPEVLLATLFGALSLAFLTGAETGWVYELLSRSGRAGEYPKVYGRLRSFEMLGGFAGTIAGGFLAGFLGMRATILLTVPFIVASFLVLATIPGDTAKSGLSYGLHLWESLKFIRKSPEVMRLLLYANVIGLPVTAFTAFMQLYFYGFLASVMAVSAISALHTAINSASWFFDAGRYREVLYRYAWIILSFVLLLAGLNEWFGFVALTLGTFTFAQAFKEWQGRFQATVPDEKRATLGSLYSLIAAVTNGVLNTLLGHLFDLVGIMRGLVAAALFFLGVGFLFSIADRKHD
ncbi:MFS transporter [Thermococcus aggregans]|uniref:MFS transporter n=1 Tax=Thermococcus aggregans TaxID=110163 RepID=A0A9E7SNH9_THEAG|nr:MFS transporter [Thermococcus aggregans]USS40361.1 MFS transporter [Thermococcus aggregans]